MLCKELISNTKINENDTMLNKIQIKMYGQKAKKY